MQIAAGGKAQPSNAQSDNATIYDFLPILQDNSPPTRNVYLGYQNFTWCCTKAVADSLTIVNGSLAFVDNPIIVAANITALLEANNNGQFPCGASYNKHLGGAPEINVGWEWYHDTCPGWQINSIDNLDAWLQPLSGFLLPAVIFCLSVPRRRKLHVVRAFFVADMAGVKSYFPAIFGAVGALLIVTVDTIFWLSMCFAFAAPMILSGLYEALLDDRVINFVKEKTTNGNLTFDMRCRLLMLVLIGNLDLALDEPLSDPIEINEQRLGNDSNQGRPSDLQLPAVKSTSNIELSDLETGSASKTLARVSTHRDISPSHSATYSDASGQPLQPPDPLSLSHYRSYSFAGPAGARARPLRRSTHRLRASPWRHMEELLYPVRLFDDADVNRALSPRQYARHNAACIDGQTCRDGDHIEEPHTRTPRYSRQVDRTRTRLRTMLQCQYSFGSIVGAPVIFFVGGFIFAYVESLSELGNEDTSLGLAFGQWYMTIPHIAIVSGLLLAGNNPNILEGVFATDRQAGEDDIKFLGLRFGLAYPSCYKVAWQWLRGHNKKLWINKVISTYGVRDSAEYAGQPEHADRDMAQLRDRTTLGPQDWVLVLSLALLLLGVPFILAFLTAYFTPEVGISCRSLTFLIYACAEFTQVMLWLWAYAGAGRIERPGQMSSENSAILFFGQNGWLDRHGFYNPTSVEHFLGHTDNGLAAALAAPMMPWNPPGSTPTYEQRKRRSIWRALVSREFWGDIRSLWCVVWYGLSFLSALIGAVAALGGTIMQLVGVYSADICSLTVQHWWVWDSSLTVMISTNTQLMIDDARKFWAPCAISAIVFMSFTAFGGWWYQRRMRDMFTELLKEIDLPENDCEAAKRARKPVPEIRINHDTEDGEDSDDNNDDDDDDGVGVVRERLRSRASGSEPIRQTANDR